jgi:molybdopterin biosynthesis enzyme
MSDRRLLSVSEAAEIVLGRVRRSSGSELVPLSKANGRVLAIDMFARMPIRPSTAPQSTATELAGTIFIVRLRTPCA